MSESLGLGQIITTPQHRDAIHIAVAPVVAQVKLAPGQDIGFIDLESKLVGIVANPIGIVDPYLKHLVFPTQEFWMYLYPGTITSLRHEWMHPAFDEISSPILEVAEPVVKPKKIAKNVAIKWMQNFADQNDIEYQEILHAANDYLEHGTYLSEGGRWEGSYVPDEFWDNYQVIVGAEVDDGQRGSFFSCSC